MSEDLTPEEEKDLEEAVVEVAIEKAIKDATVAYGKLQEALRELQEAIRRAKKA